VKTPNCYQQQSPIRMHRYMASDAASIESGTPLNGTIGQSTPVNTS
jgi:hypothetical protein